MSILNRFLILFLLKSNFGRAEKVCSEADNILGMSCGVRAINFGEKIQNLDADNDDQLKEILETCDALNYCTSHLGHCSTFQEAEIKEQFQKLNVYCDVIKFVTQEFFDCEKTLNDRQVQCYKDWDPFKLLEDMKNRNGDCGNFFGDNGCLKSEVSDNCGEDDWVKLRDKMLFLSDGAKQCNFDGIL